MSKKIVAIGGGENGRIKSDGTKTPYETEKIDKEIIKLSGKVKPNVLFLPHAQWTSENEIRYINTMRDVFEKRHGCNYRYLMVDDLKENFDKVKEYISWADIIYEGGGATALMMERWRESGLDKLLKEAWEDGKVMCGISAGSMAWFTASNTLQPEYLEKEINNVECLGFIDAYLSPHSNYDGKYESVKRTLKHIDKVGISLSNCCALEIIDDKYKIIKTDASNYGIEAFCKKNYWKNEDYIEEDILESDELKPLEELLKKE